MAQQLTLTGAHIKIFVNNRALNTAQSINITIDTGESETFGIDSPYPQEIATTRVTVRGNVSGIRTKYSGGLQALNLRPTFDKVAASPYVSIRIEDRQSGETIMSLLQCKITNESHSIATKSTYKLNFSFMAIIPLMALDLA